MNEKALKARPLIKYEVEKFIRYVQSYTDERYENIPVTSIRTSNTFRDRKHEYQVKQPSKIVRDSFFKKSYFSSLSRLLIKKGLSFCPHHEDNHEHSQHTKRIFELAKLTLDHIGEVNFDEDAFNSAYSDYFEPLYESTHTHRFIFPLPRIILRPENYPEKFRLELPPLENPINKGNYVSSIINEFTLSKITGSEMTAMQNYGTPGIITKPDQTQKRLGWSTKLDITFEVTHRPTKHNEDRVGVDPSFTGLHTSSIASDVAKQVVTALRLWDPKGYGGLGPGYRLRDSWKSYRGISDDVAGIIIPEFRQRGKVYTLSNSIEIQESERKTVRDFWTDVGPYCQLKKSDDGSLNPSLRRFSRMYERIFPEDKIIDAYIGFETTLARGHPEHYMPQFASMILEGKTELNEEDIREFVNDLQHIRNQIVHQDATLSGDLVEKVPEGEDAYFSESEYVREVRWYLAQVIIAYTDLLNSPDDSIQQINQEYLDRNDQQLVRRIKDVLLEKLDNLC